MPPAVSPKAPPGADIPNACFVPRRAPLPSGSKPLLEIPFYQPVKGTAARPVQGKIEPEDQPIRGIIQQDNQSYQRAELFEKRIQATVQSAVAQHPKAIFHLVFYIPQTMELDKDPNLFLHAVSNEIKELKMLSVDRIHENVEYSTTVRQPKIIIYCSLC